MHAVSIDFTISNDTHLLLMLLSSYFNGMASDGFNACMTDEDPNNLQLPFRATEFVHVRKTCTGPISLSINATQSQLLNMSLFGIWAHFYQWINLFQRKGHTLHHNEEVQENLKGRTPHWALWITICLASWILLFMVVMLFRIWSPLGLVSGWCSFDFFLFAAIMFALFCYAA